MAVQLKYMTGAEFVEKVLAGERDYRGIVLEQSFNLSGYEGFEEMNEYLRKQDFLQNPLDLSRVTWIYVTAQDLDLPYN